MERAGVSVPLAKEAARVQIVNTPSGALPGDEVTVNVKVTNKAGHKLPTGYAEGRQMWIHIQVVDARGSVLFEDGVLDSDGALIRTPESKVYEHVALAKDYPFLDEHDEEFHFVLNNFIEKDNRIPPKGFNKAAYTADGAFIIPHDPKDTDYPDGQNWDVTPYTFTIPPDALAPVQVKFRSASTRTTTRFWVVHFTAPIWPDIFLPLKTRPGVWF